jgi:MoaA/NifB/PqqE/SkfB family radical SAM enzyme
MSESASTTPAMGLARRPSHGSPSVPAWLRALGRRLKSQLRLGLQMRLLRHRKPALYELALRVRHRLEGRRIRLDVSTICQLKCKACWTADGLNRQGVVGWGLLKAERFERLLEENPDIRSIEIANWGEVFLNPEIVGIMEAAHRRGVRLSAVSGANLNRVTDEALEALVKYGFHHLSVSIDGTSRETYEQYRVGGNFDDVIANVRRINHYKRIYGSDLPHLTWQFIIFGHNEHELPEARRWAEELGMEFAPKLNHTPSVSPVKDEEFVRRASGLGAASRSEYRETVQREYNAPCIQLWNEPQINWDGKMLGCCANKYGDFGNVFEEGLENVLTGPKFVRAKNVVLGRVSPREDDPCFGCPVYRRLNPEMVDTLEPTRHPGGKHQDAPHARRRASPAS